MPATSEVVTLVVDGDALQGWQGVHVTRSAKAAAISFSLRASNPAWSADARKVRRGRQIQIFTAAEAEGGALGHFDEGGSDLLCTGYADSCEVESAPGQHEVGIAGRSKAGDAIDCPPVRHKTGRVEKKKLDAVAREFDEWGLGFHADVDLNELPEVQIVPGESLFDCLEREARHQGLLLPGQPDGSVKITRAGSKRHAGGLVHGQDPAMRWKLRTSIEHKRSEVRVRGQRSLGVDDDALEQEEKAEDKSVGRHRPHIVHHEGDHVAAELKRRAEWEQLRRSGSGITVEVKVATWRDEAGRLWEPGLLVPVDWADEEVSQDLAISTVTFNQVVGDGEGAGTWADLTLVDPRTLGAKGAGSGSGSGAGGGGGKKGGDFGGLPGDRTQGLPDGAFSNPSIKAGPR